MKKKGYNGHIGLGRGKPYKKFGRKRQKFEDCACPNWREKNEFEKVLKKVIWISQIWLLKKAYSRFSIDWKLVSIDRNRQKLT